MYLSLEETEFSNLRQGDIISETQYLGALNLNNIHLITSPNGQTKSWQFQSTPIFGPAAVLSHSCEIDRANTVKLTSIILAPLRDINKATAPDKVNELIESNFLNEEIGFSYFKYFYLEPNPQIPFSKGAIIDFSKCYSVRNQSYDSLVMKKVLQLNSTTASQMALKLSVYFYREQESA